MSNFVGRGLIGTCNCLYFSEILVDSYFIEFIATWWIVAAPQIYTSSPYVYQT